MPIFHDGELRVQTRAGVHDRASRTGRMTANVIPANAMTFVAQQSMAVLGSVDEHGQPWCSVIFGEPGFVHAPDTTSVVINTGRMGVFAQDPFWRNIQTQAGVGMLLIELSTRRRLRINGKLQQTTALRYTLQIEQAYPNCPKYIQRRLVRPGQTTALPLIEKPECGQHLQAPQKKWIAQADTFFVASAHPARDGQYHVDASHRGGKPGFVEILNDSQLRIPDFAGNNMFNTLGNIESYPHAGLAFIDFEQKRILQLAGQARILWDQAVPVDTTGGTHRYWEFEIAHWQVSAIPFAIDWEFQDYSPLLP